jgi:hypothetical protein
MKNKFNADSVLADIVLYPEAEQILIKHNIPCITCPRAKEEMGELKIGDVCRMYNINLDEVLEELNKIDN